MVFGVHVQTHRVPGSDVGARERRWREQGGYMRFVLKNVPSRHRAGHLEQQGMWMIPRVVCWEPVCVSRKDDPADGESRKNWHTHKGEKPGRGKARRSSTDRTTRGVECDADGRRRGPLGRHGHGRG